MWPPITRWEHQRDRRACFHIARRTTCPHRKVQSPVVTDSGMKCHDMGAIGSHRHHIGPRTLHDVGNVVWFHADAHSADPTHGMAVGHLLFI